MITRGTREQEPGERVLYKYETDWCYFTTKAFPFTTRTRRVEFNNSICANLFGPLAVRTFGHLFDRVLTTISLLGQDVETSGFLEIGQLDVRYAQSEWWW